MASQQMRKRKQTATTQKNVRKYTYMIVCLTFRANVYVEFQNILVLSYSVQLGIDAKYYQTGSKQSINHLLMSEWQLYQRVTLLKLPLFEMNWIV